MTKRDAIILVMTGVFIGIVLGYSWRLIQIEPILNREMSLVYRENRILSIENEAMKAKVAAYEVGLKKKKEMRGK